MAYWADSLLIGLFLPMVAGFVGSWLWAKYDASDFATRRSVTSTRKKIKKLEQRLQNFEIVFADTKLFLARIILDSTVLISLVVGTVLIILWLFFDVVVLTTLVVGGVHLEGGVKRHVMMWEWPLAIVLAIGIFFMSLQARRLERECVTPEAYKRNLSQRIARLRSRLPGNA
jgi:hypothetical protein